MSILLFLDLVFNISTSILIFTGFITYLMSSPATPQGHPEPWVATRDDLTHLYQARESRRQDAIAAASASPKSWQAAMTGPAYPQTLQQFQQLPTEIKIQIIRIAIKEAIGEKCTKQMQLFDRRYLAAVEGWRCVKMDYLVRTVEAMKRVDLIRADCLGGLLGACRLLRNETIAWVEVRRTKGEAWGSERGVRGGKAQVPYRVDGGPLRARGIRRDAKRWMAALYQFSRVYDGGWEIANDNTWSRPSDKETERVEILD